LITSLFIYLKSPEIYVTNALDVKYLT